MRCFPGFYLYRAVFSFSINFKLQPGRRKFKTQLLSHFLLQSFLDFLDNGVVAAGKQKIFKNLLRYTLNHYLALLLGRQGFRLSSIKQLHVPPYSSVGDKLLIILQQHLTYIK